MTCLNYLPEESTHHLIANSWFAFSSATYWNSRKNQSSLPVFQQDCVGHIYRTWCIEFEPLVYLSPTGPCIVQGQELSCILGLDSSSKNFWHTVILNSSHFFVCVVFILFCLQITFMWVNNTYTYMKYTYLILVNTEQCLNFCGYLENLAWMVD